MSKESCYVPRGPLLSRLTVDAGLLHPTDAADVTTQRPGTGSTGHTALSSSVHAQTLGLGHALMTQGNAQGSGGSGHHHGHHHQGGGGGSGGTPGSMLGALRSPQGVHSMLGGSSVAGLGALMEDIRPLVDFEDPPPLSSLGFSAGNTLGGGTSSGGGKPLTAAPLNAPVGGSRQLPGRLPVGSRRRTGGPGGAVVVTDGDGGGYWGGSLNAAVASSFGGRPGPSNYGGFVPSMGVVVSSLQQQSQYAKNAALTNPNATQPSSAQPSQESEGTLGGGAAGHNATTATSVSQHSAAINLLSSGPSPPTSQAEGMAVTNLPPPPPIVGGRSLLGLLGAAATSSTGANAGTGVLVSSAGDTLYCDGHWNELGLPLPLD